MKLALTLFAVLAVAPVGPASAADRGTNGEQRSAPADSNFEWELQRDRDGIQVYTRAVENSKFKAVKSVMTMDSSLTELAALVRDAQACPEWADLCKEARVIEEVSDTEMYVYTYNDLPWPVSDRDAVAHVTWTQDPQTLAVEMSAIVVADKLPKERGAVRLTYGVTGWTFTPTESGQIAIESRAHVDPAGATPAWLTNRLLVDSPFTTMQSMRDVINTGRYADTTLEFIKEPQ